jgi:hypothetical protein
MEGAGTVTITRRRCVVALASVAAAIVGGCSETLSLGQLPDVTKLPDKVLSKDEQQGKVNDMIAKGQSHQDQAVKEIEGGK